MTGPNRVDELRKRYHEHPKRFFAPLANEYRKTGFLDRAILLCEKHLAEQPDNMNGLVVYGQCLFESGRHAEAVAPFEGALAVDPENLIALRHLGDIARLEGHAEQARAWYERVLELDRRNDEVLELIEQVGGRRGGEPGTGASALPSNLVTVAPSVRVSGRDGARTPQGSPAVDSPPAAPEAAAFDYGTVDLDAPPADAPRASAEAAEVASDRPSRRAPIPDSTAPTVEVSRPEPPVATGAPKKRASLLDIAFDFGESGVGADAFLDAPRAPTAPLGEAQVTPPPAEPPSAPIRLQGLEAAEYQLEVDPIAGLESSEFEGGGGSAPLAGLETGEFSAAGTAPLPGLESAGFDPTAFDGAAAAAPTPPAAEEPPTFRVADDEVEEPPTFGGGAEAEDSPFGDMPDTQERPTFSVRADEVEEEPLIGAGPAKDHASDLPLLPPLGSDEGALEAAGLEERSGISELPGAGEEPTPRTFVTETMAKVYLAQGFRDRAIEVYRQLIAQDPGDAGLRERLAALEQEARASLGFEPAVEAEEPEQPPANAMLADVSFAGVTLETPSAGTPPPATPSAPGAPARPTPRSTSPAPAPAPEPGPSAREFLGAFARRALTPVATAAVAGAAGGAASSGAGGPSPALPGGGLDVLFGGRVDAADDRAAHRLAAVGATSGPSGGSAMDSLFGEGPSAPLPAALPRASDRLKFDQFFSGPAASTPKDAPGASAASEGAGATPQGDAPPGDGDDDLDQFQGWLRGLTS